MTWTKRSTRNALAGYLLVAALVCGGLAWATVVSLRLERAELTTRAWQDSHHRLHLAMSRLERRVQNTLIRETQRNVYEYVPCYYPPDLWYEAGLPVPPGDVVEVSPVVDSEFEPWFVLHFQVSPGQGWTSPQASMGKLDFLADFEPPVWQSSQTAAEVLAALQGAVTPDQLGEMLAEAKARDLANALWTAPEGEERTAAAVADVSTSNAAAGPPGEKPGAAQDRPAASEYAQRKRQTLQALRSSQAGEACDLLDVALVNLNQSPAGRALMGQADVDDHVSVTRSEMTAIWLPLGEGGEDYLAFVGTVSLCGEDIYQGFLLDWEMLRTHLLAEISDLFPTADLVPVKSGPVEDPESLLTMLPARLDAPAGVVQAAVGWTPMRSGLLLAWVAAATVLAAVGLGVRSLLTLTERRTQFAYAVSHELRTPLTTFRLYTDMLAGGLVPAESRHEYLQTLSAESERLSQLVAGVLEYSRLEHHSVQLAPTEMTVGELLESARGRYEPRCLEAQRQLTIETNGIADQRRRTDPDLTLQIIGTLIDNACKYACQASDPRIIVSAGNDRDGRLRLEVRDFGPGIPRKERRRIFKPFHRGKDWATNSAGIGLGLALARRWARLLGGNLELVTDRQHRPGACFCLSIPELTDSSP